MIGNYYFVAVYEKGEESGTFQAIKPFHEGLSAHKDVFA